ncbi:MAG: tetratricopeptide repeat protein, partial [Gammaproteobacteria bacterium]|nr:tetratricopeptide repeat protein [Gammaproteobacteria bacterium]
LRLNPDFVEAHNNLGTALRALNRLAEAEAAYRAALRLRPEYVEALVNLGVVLHSQDKVEEAIASLLQALQINPHSAEAHNNLGNVYALAGRLTEAIASYREALRLKPRSADTFNNLFNTHLRRGELEEALACHREAVRLDPERATATYSGYLLNLNYHPDLTPQAIFEEHRHWGKVYAPRPELPAAYINSREPGRRLRIGYVSADFRLHSVAFFMEPVLAHHDHTHFEIYCYAQVAAPDSVTERLKQLATTWRSIVGLDDEQAAALIRSDEIDILVDLGGHTAGNRLGVFARRPAPVQTSYIGYPNTTGLPAMDYRIVNPWTVPAGFEAYFTEKLAYVPSPPCFRPPADCPPVNAPPALTSGQVTFGSFNNLIKLASPVIALWAAVLQAVPDSRLMLKSKALADAEIRDLYHARFAAHGIGPDRLLLCGADPLQEYLRAFNDIDIALDPFPYNGGTTTYHASWMGVPVVTLLGQNMVSRMGYAILANLGLEELVAKTPAEYVTIAANLATDPGRLSALRASLRERMRGSSLTDGRLAASALETLYRDIWRSWCLDTNTAPSLDKE